jgi:hypothetical protein
MAQAEVARSRALSIDPTTTPRLENEPTADGSKLSETHQEDLRGWQANLTVGFVIFGICSRRRNDDLREQVFNANPFGQVTRAIKSFLEHYFMEQLSHCCGAHAQSRTFTRPKSSKFCEDHDQSTDSRTMKMILLFPLGRPLYCRNIITVAVSKRPQTMSIFLDGSVVLAIAILVLFVFVARGSVVSR